MRAFVPFFAAVVMVAASCGGKTPPKPANTPAPEQSSAPAASSAAEATPAPTATEKAPEMARSPKSIVSDADSTFVLAFEQSDAGKTAEEKCTASSKGDQKKQQACMEAARKKIQVAAMRFRKDSENNWYWETLKPQGKDYTTIKKTQIEFGEEGEHSVVIKPKNGQPVTIEVPNEYSIAVKDSQHGRLVYEARLAMKH